VLAQRISVREALEDALARSAEESMDEIELTVLGELMWLGLHNRGTPSRWVSRAINAVACCTTCRRIHVSHRRRLYNTQMQGSQT
jgi:hypothetical protein